MVQRYRKLERGGMKVDDVNRYIFGIYGYFMGGENLTTSDKITYSSGTTAADSTSNLTVNNAYSHSGLTDKVTYGYIAGGYSSANFATANRLTYSTSTTAANTVSNLTTARRQGSALSDGSLYGYWGGGYTSANVVTTDRITLVDSGTYGYWSGVYLSNTSDKITFSTGATAASTASNLSLARDWTGGLADHGRIYGYWSGGQSNATVALTDRMTFSSSTIAAQTTSNLQAVRLEGGNCNDGVYYGYRSGGYTGANTASSEKLTYSTETFAANTATNLSSTRRLSIGFSDYII